MKNRFGFSMAGLLLAATSLVTVQAATAQPAQAAPCLSRDNGHTWVATAHRGTSSTPTYTATRNCQDVNFEYISTQTVQDPLGHVRVCFVRAGSCNAWKRYNGDTATRYFVVASNVADGTTYRVEFLWDQSVYGSGFTFAVFG